MPADRSEAPTHHPAPLSANAQAWRRLVRDGYGRTAEQVRASRPAPLQRDIGDTPEH